MKCDTELALIDQALAQLASKTRHMAGQGRGAPVPEYICADRYVKEVPSVIRGFPVALAHVDEIPCVGDSILRELAKISIIIMHCSDGVPRAILNACRHRGSRLLSATRGNHASLSAPIMHGVTATEHDRDAGCGGLL